MVHFVGAGPGAADLITLRGASLIRQADVIIYAGSLVNPELLKDVKKECLIYDSSRLTLPETIRIMKDAEDAGKEIIRLHTGDPSLYGAVREQMDELEKLEIPYDVTPGVSSVFAAAAAIGAEYTLPGISQSLILSRIEGRTAVPEKESIEALSSHQATMAFFLSVSEAEKLQERLLQGGYPEKTPVAVVKRVSWPDEELIFCPLRELADTVKEHGIRKTALILVGEAVGHRAGSLKAEPSLKSYEKSRLYAPDFSTGFRQGKDGGKPFFHIIYFTDRGEELSGKLLSKLKKQGYEADRASGRQEKLSEWTAEHFIGGKVLIFIGAAGIAVRAVAPFVKKKEEDPAVIVTDEQGRYWIPILSGHIGGANRAAEELSRLCGGQPVLTTATDGEGLFSVDVFAKDNGLVIPDLNQAKGFSAKLLSRNGAALIISPEKREGFYLIPRCIILGAGCRKGKTKEELLAFMLELLDGQDLSRYALCCIASIDRKKDEQGLKECAQELSVPFLTFSAEELAAVPGAFTASKRVSEETGVDNVCERAVMAAGAGKLLVRKTVKDGMTLALGIREVNLTWPGSSIASESDREI